MSLGAQAADSDQRSSADSGISRTYKEPLSADAYKESQMYGQAAQEFFNSPFGYFRGQHVNQLVPQSEYGLPVQATQWMNAMAKNALNTYSAGGAFKGMLSPENTSNIVGGALQGMASTVLPMALENSRYMTMLPDNLMANRLGFLQASQGSKAQLLGSSSDYSGSSNSFGFGIGIGGRAY